MADKVSHSSTRERETPRACDECRGGIKLRPGHGCLEHSPQDGGRYGPGRCQPSQGPQAAPADGTRTSPPNGRRPLLGRLSCQGCSQGARATWRCQDCRELLCQDCGSIHRKVNATRSHALLSLREALRSPHTFLVEHDMCHRHPEVKVSLFCGTCSTPVCAECACTEHRKCEEPVELTRIMNEKKKEISSLCGELDEMQRSFQTKQEESEASERALESSLQDAMKRMGNTHAKILCLVVKGHKQASRDLVATAKSDWCGLAEQTATFRCVRKATQTAAQSARDQAALCGAWQVCSLVPELQTTLQELREKASAEVVTAPSYQVSPVSTLHTLLREVGLAEVADKIPVPKKETSDAKELRKQSQNSLREKTRSSEEEQPVEEEKQLLEEERQQSALGTLEGDAGKIQQLEQSLRLKDEEMSKLQKQIMEMSTTSGAAAGATAVTHTEKPKVSILSPDIGSLVLLCYEENYRQYIAFTVGNVLFFVHSESLAELGLTLDPSNQNRKKWELAEVCDKEYCQAKKSNNRFNVPVGTKFYRIRAKPWKLEGKFHHSKPSSSSQ